MTRRAKVALHQRPGQYIELPEDPDGTYEAAGTAAATMAAHVATSDPHPQYTTAGELAAAIAAAAGSYQPLDSDLSAIAALTAAANDILQFKSGAWVNRTLAQLLTDLNLGAIYQPLDTQLTSLAGLSYTGNALKVVRVNAAETGFELATPAAGGGGAVTYIGTTTVSPSPVTSFSISGLDLNTDGMYLAEVYLKNATASNTLPSLYLNADTAAGNYDREAFGFNNTSAAGGRSNDGAVIVLSASTIAQFSLKLLVQGGRVFARAVGRDGTTGLTSWWFEHQWRTTGTNVTGFTFSSNVANSLDATSSCKLWKMS